MVATVATLSPCARAVNSWVVATVAVVAMGGTGMINVGASDQCALHVYTALPYIFGNVHDHRNRDFQALR